MSDPQLAPAPHGTDAVAAEVLATDAAVLGEEFAVKLTGAAAALPPTVLDRIVGWSPQFAQRGLTVSRWRQVAPVVRAGVVCARPSSEEVAGDLLTDALSMALFAAERRTPLQPQFVFRETTAKAYLATVSAASRATVSSRVKSLVTGAARPVAVPAEASTDTDADETGASQAAGVAGDADGPETAVEPLLMDRPAPARRQLSAAGLSGQAAQEALATLAAVRDQVLLIEPSALRREPRFRGRGRAVPYGDVEVVALLAAAATHRSLKRRLHASATICLGVGAGVTGEAAARLTGADVIRDASHPGDVLVQVGERLVAVHAAFSGPVLAAAAAAGPDGWLIGGGQSRRSRVSDLAAGLANTDAHLVRLSSARLAATWLALQATRGVPVGDLLAAYGTSSTAPLDLVLPFLPKHTDIGRALLAGRRVDRPTLAAARDDRDDAAGPDIASAASAASAASGDDRELDLPTGQQVAS